MAFSPDQPTVATHRSPDSVATMILVPIVVGAVVAVARHVRPGARTNRVAINVAGFSGAQAAKSWLTTGTFLLADIQLVSLPAMWGKLPSAPWIPTLHRWSGRSAVLLTVPVVVHCLYALGFQSVTPRVLIHSLLGCFFFGAFTATMLLLTRRGLPNWVIPLIGGLVFSALVSLWLTSSFWSFTTVGVTL